MSKQLSLFGAPDEPADTAVFSGCMKHRYLFTRTWNTSLPRMVWVLLNPSTGTEFKDDPTLRKCTMFSKREGYGSISVVNLYSFRTPEPKEMWDARKRGEPIDGLSANMETIAREMCEPGTVAVGWGTDLQIDPARVAAVMALIKNGPPVCLGRNKDNSPKHPLYLANHTAFRPWSPHAL